MVKTMISKQLVIGGIVGAIAVTALGATAGYQMLDSDNYAEVVAVTPVFKTVSVPREECRDQLVSVVHPTQDPNQIAGTIAGAVIGGLAGSQLDGQEQTVRMTDDPGRRIRIENGKPVIE
ncbi:MAG: hypothetical protein MUO51_16905 [Woeseiaceae bacterium]|nr:hypothetical protein [Woeseiaceae bacterium]